MTRQKYTIIKDTREKEGHGYNFQPSDYFTGMVVKKLDTGDYSIQDLENKIIVERKESVTEFANNISDPRFFRELERFSNVEHGYLFLEFYLDDIVMWPLTSGIPKHKLPFIKTTGKFLLLKLNEIQINYNVKTLFVGSHGQQCIDSLFRRLIEKYERR